MMNSLLQQSNKPLSRLMFMHFYHHALTGYFAFVNFYSDNAYLVWGAFLNYLIHFWMYRLG